MVRTFDDSEKQIMDYTIRGLEVGAIPNISQLVRDCGLPENAWHDVKSYVTNWVETDEIRLSHLTGWAFPAPADDDEMPVDAFGMGMAPAPDVSFYTHLDEAEESLATREDYHRNCLQEITSARKGIASLRKALQL